VVSGVNLRTLEEIGEWAAYGFYEALEKPYPRSYGRAYRRMYENMPVRVPDDRYLIPFEPMVDSRDFVADKLWFATSFICDHNHHCGLRVNPGVAKEKKRQFPQHATFIDALVVDLSQRLPHFGGYTHSNPDMRRVVNEGFLSMEAELDAQIELTRQERDADPATLNLLLSLRDYAAGIHAFYNTTLQCLCITTKGASGERRRQLQRIADSFAECFMVPASTFLQGLLAVNFTWMLDGCDSIGRFDQVLGALFERDRTDGTLDLDFSRQLLDELWQNFERLNGWNMQIGGYTPDGRDGCNALTLECIGACGRNKVRRPNVAFRITRETPDSAVMEALKVLRLGSGRPALYNDDAYVKTLYEMDLGLSREDSREIGFGGCTETMIAGLSNVGSLEGMLNLAKALELALNDGCDPMEGRQAGPHTGDFVGFRTFDGFYQAVKRQIQYMTDTFVTDMNAQLRRRFTEGDPKMPRTFFTRDCIRRRKSFEAGGARYNWSVVSYQGIANLIDSIIAIRKCVFQDGSVRAQELMAALSTNFEGAEPLRQQLLDAPKFGNDSDYVDVLASDVIDHAWRTLYSHEPPRGGRYLASCILFATYGGAGKIVGATPDGRKAYEPLTDSVGAMQGCDTNGPTALLNSVTRLPLHLGVGTPILNIRLLKKTMESDQELRALVHMIRAYFSNGGLQLQISVISKEEMLAAQKEPEKHRDLIVRIGGYSEYFVVLPKELQESVIARTEHSV